MVSNSNSYQSLDNGLFVDDVMRHLTGEGKTNMTNEISKEKLKKLLNNFHKRPTVLGSIDETPPNPDIVGDHTFAVVGFHNNVITLIDALERDNSKRVIDIPFAEVHDNFQAVVQGAKKPA